MKYTASFKRSLLTIGISLLLGSHPTQAQLPGNADSDTAVPTTATEILPVPTSSQEVLPDPLGLPGESDPIEDVLTPELRKLLFDPSVDRPKILFQPAIPTRGSDGLAILRPDVRLADTEEVIAPSMPRSVFTAPTETVAVDEQRIAVASAPERTTRRAWIPQSLHARANKFRQRGRPLNRLEQQFARYLNTQRGRDVGVGAERLPFALFEMDAAKPSNNIRFRLEAGYDWEFPDRAEFFWSRLGGKGPSLTVPTESSVDYQDLRLAIEVGGPKFSATTELPLRFINPTELENTGGLGDLILTTKTVMVDGERFRLTQVLRNQLATGTAKSGRGNGHVSMEPGVVAAYQWTDRTMIHSELKLWFPIGGEPGFSGPILRYGFGAANLLYDSDTFAILPTFEVVGWSVLNAQRTGTLGAITSIDGEDIINIYPGMRIVRDFGGDYGMFDFGINGGFAVTSRHWYDSLIRMDLRWSF
ncbi:MAG: hypothetical protein AAFX06_19395 [Planctomycetota bacterium]